MILLATLVTVVPYAMAAAEGSGASHPGALISRDGRLFYVSGETAGDLTVIDTTARAAVARVIHGGGDAMGLALLHRNNGIELCR